MEKALLFKKGQMSLNPQIKVRTVNKEQVFKVLSLCVVYVTAVCTHRSLRHIGLSSLRLSTFSSETGFLTELEAHLCTLAGWAGVLRDLPICTLPLPSSRHPHCPGWIYRHAPPCPAFLCGLQGPNSGPCGYVTGSLLCESPLQAGTPL